MVLALVVQTGCASRPRAFSPGKEELLRDARFQRGFFLLEPKPGKRVIYGRLAGFDSDTEPAWELGQWSSRFPLRSGDGDRLTSRQSLAFNNPGKLVSIGRYGRSDADLSLLVNGSAEYGARARKSGNEPWVHLLVQQELVQQPALVDLKACPFHLEARLKQSTLHRTDDYSPQLHAAQFFAYLIVANRNKTSPGFGEYFWFGVPIYDDRHRMVPAFEAQDFGQSKMFIYTPQAELFCSKSTHDGEWVTFEKDLLPLIREGLEHAWAKGFVLGSRNFADYRITGIYIGWEVPGIFDVELQIRNLSLKAVPENM